jgi:phosphate transport system substrate-binding protein
LSTNHRRPDGRRTIKHSGRRGVIALAALAALLPALVLPAVASAKNYKLFGSGSSAAEPYMQVLFAKYHKLHHNVSFVYNADGGNQGEADVANGRSSFAIQTTFKPVGGVSMAPLLYDALCVDVNSKNSVSSAAIPTLRNIYDGTTLSWSGVSGSNLGSATIDPQGRTSAAGQYTFFTAAVMNGSSYASNVTALSSDGLVANAIRGDKDAIGYVGLANSKRSGEKALKISRKAGGTAYACSAKNVRSRKYPMWRFDYGVIPFKHQNAQVLKFFNWITDTKTAAALINRVGAVATPKHVFGNPFS